MSVADPATLRAAVELFNRGSYLAAHELFEELWEAGEGPDADFHKGLVQASVALHHLEEGRLEGAASLFRGHRALLARYAPTHLGIDVTALLEDMQATLRARMTGQEVEALPRIRRDA